MDWATDYLEDYDLIDYSIETKLLPVAVEHEKEQHYL
jgi:hypothetical protein